MSDNTNTKTIVVFGATGVQGTSFIQAISGTPSYRIIALSRNPTSGTSKRLASLPNVEVIQIPEDGMDNPSKVFENLPVGKGDVYGVLSIQGYVDDKIMVNQGKAIADAASEFGVKHFVYSSSDFGGLDNCGIKGFEVKREVENHIKTLSPFMGYTFLRPVQFMDNWLPTAPFFLKMGRTVTLKYTFYTHPDRKHQLISSKDIGIAAKEAFIRGPTWQDGIVRLAGDGLTMNELQSTFKEVLGEQVRTGPAPLVYVVSKLVPIVTEAAIFFDQHGYNVDIAQVKTDLPETEDLRTFLTRWKAEQK